MFPYFSRWAGKIDDLSELPFTPLEATEIPSTEIARAAGYGREAIRKLYEGK
jgi:hypothetical protein